MISRASSSKTGLPRGPPRAATAAAPARRARAREACWHGHHAPWRLGGGGGLLQELQPLALEVEERRRRTQPPVHVRVWGGAAVPTFRVGGEEITRIVAGSCTWQLNAADGAKALVGALKDNAQLTAIVSHFSAQFPPHLFTGAAPLPLRLRGGRVLG